MSFPHRQRMTSVGPRLERMSLARINKDGRAQLWPLWEGFNRFCCVGLYVGVGVYLVLGLRFQGWRLRVEG